MGIFLQRKTELVHSLYPSKQLFEGRHLSRDISKLYILRILVSFLMSIRAATMVEG
jgi:hypothetical protein